MVATLHLPGPHSLPRAAYDAIAAVNWSRLRALRRSPLHYQHALTVPREDTDSMRVGRASHTAVLEPGRFELEYVVWRGGRRYGREWDAFQVAHAGQTILREEDYLRACAIRDAVLSHPAARAYLADGFAEQTVTWTDEATGLPCKGRLDWISLGGAGAVVDLKTSRGPIDVRSFGRTVATYGYHAQLAFYSAGVKAAYGMPRPAVLIAVENEAPHDVVVYRLSDDALYAGEEECAELLRRLKACEDSGSWPGQALEEQTLDLPAWYYAQAEQVGVDQLAAAGEALMEG